MTFFWQNPVLGNPSLLDRLFGEKKWWVIQYERGRAKMARGPFTTREEAEREYRKDPDNWDRIEHRRTAPL